MDIQPCSPDLETPHSPNTEPTAIEATVQQSNWSSSDRQGLNTIPSQSGQSLQSSTDTQEKRRTASRGLWLLILILFAAICVGSYKLVQRESQNAVESTHHTCQLIAQTLLDQQNDDGGFSGIPQLPSSLWDTAQQISALAYAQKCGIEITDAQKRAAKAMLTWQDEETLKWQHGYGAGWFFLSTAGLENPDLTAKAKALLDQFRLSNGAYAVTLRDKEENKADPYATTMAAWGMYMHGEDKSHPPYQDTIIRLRTMLEAGVMSEISGLEEQAWWTLWTIGKRHQVAIGSLPASRHTHDPAVQMG